MKRRLDGVDEWARVGCIVAKEIENIAVQLIGSGSRSDRKLSTCRGSGLRRGERGDHAKLLDGVERNGEADVTLLSLIDDIGRVDAVVGEIVVVAPAASHANAPFVAAVAQVGVHSERSERC